MFRLHARLAADTVPVGRLALSQALLSRDARFPWLILVPERPGLTGMHQLDDAGRRALMQEIAAASRTLERLFAPERINVEVRSRTKSVSSVEQTFAWQAGPG